MEPLHFHGFEHLLISFFYFVRHFDVSDIYLHQFHQFLPFPKFEIRCLLYQEIVVFTKMLSLLSGDMEFSSFIVCSIG